MAWFRAVRHLLKNVTPVIMEKRKLIVQGTGGGTSLGLFNWIFNEWKLKETLSIDDVKALPITPLDDLNYYSNHGNFCAKFELLCYRIQKEVCDAIEEIERTHETLEKDSKSTQEGKTFFVDRWEREDKRGGGITCILEDGVVFERAGVNISVIEGNLPRAAIVQMKSRGKDLIPGPDGQLPFVAVGVSSVIHPRNPNIPTMHFNYRYFEVHEFDEKTKKNKKTWWFGGGSDMTPYILYEEDAVHFHSTLKKACEKTSKKLYPKFKKWCDDYFFIEHRNERRGIGGIFFDDHETSKPEVAYNFVRDCAESVIPSYIPIVKKRKDVGYGYADRQWQLLRRGRYVEFNLIHDRGTKFGLSTPGARIESILMSLPSEAKWQYRHTPTPGSREDQLVQVLKNPREWV